MQTVWIWWTIWIRLQYKHLNMTSSICVAFILPFSLSVLWSIHSHFPQSRSLLLLLMAAVALTGFEGWRQPEKCPSHTQPHNFLLEHNLICWDCVTKHTWLYYYSFLISTSHAEIARLCQTIHTHCTVYGSWISSSIPCWLLTAAGGDLWTGTLSETWE